MLGSSEISESGVKVGSRILKRYVLQREQVEVATRQHWAVMIEPVLSVLLGFLLVSWITINLERMFGTAGGYLWVLWLLVVGRLLWQMLEWRNEWFVATDKRLLLTYGLISHKVAMMPLGKVTDMTYDRSIMGRVLGYGTFVMESAGQDQALQKIRWVPKPDETYREICDIIFDPHGHDSDDSLPDDSHDRVDPEGHRHGIDHHHDDDSRYDSHDEDDTMFAEHDRGQRNDDGTDDDQTDGDQTDGDREEGLHDSGDEADDDDDHDSDDWSGDHSTPSPSENAGWQTSREGASTYQRVMPRKQPHSSNDDDEDMTGPIPVISKGP